MVAQLARSLLRGRRTTILSARGLRQCVPGLARKVTRRGMLSWGGQSAVGYGRAGKYRWRVSLSAAWEDHADEWIAWARFSRYDGFWEGTWPALRELLPEPGPGPVIDVGCGEGRAGGELVKLGYRVVGLDRSPPLAAAAASADPAMPVLLADAAAMPFSDQSSDLVVACISLLDVDDFDGAVSEIGRVLRPVAGCAWRLGTRSCQPGTRTPCARRRSGSPGPTWSRAGGPTRSSGTG